MELGKRINRHIPSDFTDTVMITLDDIIMRISVAGKSSIDVSGLRLSPFLFTLFRNISL